MAALIQTMQVKRASARGPLRSVALLFKLTLLSQRLLWKLCGWDIRHAKYPAQAELERGTLERSISHGQSCARVQHLAPTHGSGGPLPGLRDADHVKDKEQRNQKGWDEAERQNGHRQHGRSGGSD